jgi:putative membrane protein
MMSYGYWGWGSGLFWFGGFLLVVGVVVLVIWAISTTTRNGREAAHDPSRPTPNEILRERFARGEITEQEFEQAKKVLGPDR